MPMLYLHTSFDVGALATSQIMLDCADAVARVLGKPDKYVMVLLESNVDLWCGAGEEPAAWAELVSIGELTPDETENARKALADVLKSKLSLCSLHLHIHCQSVKSGSSSDNVSCLHAIHQ
ncbi:hypothetical protein KP509_34G033500 [Ceratopteris richardii]|uniref:L-dopachrome isomerase n=1 Tax=Ceratopteris richardii TaxID=49495 RepID=A0A8T2QK38_CERRI|nr:hypothetical protein KP509_34G033500 [Ceratopteris richardii]